MRNLKYLVLLIALGCLGWTSETGSGVVSTNETIVRTSLEATQVLQSDTLTNLFGVTVLGGTTNYTSSNSGGVLNTQNVVSSVDTVKMLRNQYLSWAIPAANMTENRFGVSANNVYVWQAGAAENISLNLNTTSDEALYSSSSGSNFRFARQVTIHPELIVADANVSLDPVITASLGQAPLAVAANNNTVDSMANIAYGANSNGGSVRFLKTRATNTAATTIVQNADGIISIRGSGADGTAYRQAGALTLTVDGTPGASDMPGRWTIATTPDGSASPSTVAEFTESQATVLAGALTSTANNAGMSIQSAANTACTTTCTSAAMFGYDSGTNLPVGPTDATADACFCMGSR